MEEGGAIVDSSDSALPHATRRGDRPAGEAVRAGVADADTDADRVEAELVRAALDGRVRAFEELLGRHEARVLRVLRLMGVPPQDREDVAQDVFIRVFRHLDRFQRGRPFRSWIYRITVNAAHDYRSRLGRRSRETHVDEPIERVDPSADPGADAERRDLRQQLLRAMETLSDRERAVFALVEIEGLETREVARALGIAGVTVRRHLGLARRRLRKSLTR